MIRLTLFGLLITSAIFGCKQRSNSSSAKSENDIQDGSMHWVESESKFAIRCRDGKLHNGFKSTLIRSDELKNACEQVDPNFGKGGPITEPITGPITGPVV